MSSGDQPDVPKLDKDAFKKTVTVPCIEIETKKLNNVLLYMKPFLFKQVNCPAVLEDGKETVKHVLLNPDKVKSMEDLGESVCRKLASLQIPDVLQFRELDLNYDNLKAEEVFKQIFPEPLSSFSTIGHIAHLNLKEHHLPYKYIIGQVLLDKNRPNIKMVVNKTSTIENKFRFFPMEVLARESEDVTTMVDTKVGSCRFQFDFSNVYWNSRLNTEHNRVIEQLRAGMDVAYDVFAGVGPFSISLAKKRCKALANDLNPESYKWLMQNAVLNKVTEYHSSYNMDGRDFIKTVVKNDIVSEWKAFDSGEDGRVKMFHIIMNLPALAVEFLDAFVGWLDQEEETMSDLTFVLPVIHCYTFVKGVPLEACEQAVISSSEASLQTKIKDLHEVKLVRKVSPDKLMFRISFGLPLDACLTKKRHKKLKSDRE